MTEQIISRGFHGRRQQSDLGARLPPGQYLENGFPVLSAGPTPHSPTGTWNFSVWEGGRERKRWTWDEFQALPHEEVIADIHCVTKWSKLDTHWEGVSVDRVLDGLADQTLAALPGYGLDADPRALRKADGVHVEIALQERDETLHLR